MEDVNIFVRTLLVAIHVHVTLGIHLDQMITIVKVLLVDYPSTYVILQLQARYTSSFTKY